MTSKQNPSQSGRVEPDSVGRDWEHCLQHRSQKLDSLSRMAAGIAHDFNNLLLAIMGNADLLDQDLREGQEVQPLLDEIRKAAGRAADLCSQLFAFAGKGQFNFQPLDLSATAREMIPMLKVAVPRRVGLRLELRDDLPLIEADVSHVHQIIMNLVVNASEAIGPRDGSISLLTGSGHLDPSGLDNCVVGGGVPAGDFVWLEVRDSGEGMDRDTMQRIFDPFFTTKIQGRGLGLASVLGTVRGHQATLCFDSTPGSGSLFRVHFPVAGVRMPAPRWGRPGQSTAVGRGTVLVVDDEEYVRVLSLRMLGRLGYQVILAGGGHEALEILRERGKEIDCVMLDLIMPELDGVQVYEQMTRIDPDVRVVMTSGYHEQEIATRFAGKGIDGFLQKPYVVADLAAALGRIMKPGSAGGGSDPGR